MHWQAMVQHGRGESSLKSIKVGIEMGSSRVGGAKVLRIAIQVAVVETVLLEGAINGLMLFELGEGVGRTTRCFRHGGCD